MQGCHDFEQLIRHWEETGEFSPDSWPEVEAHIKVCPRCRRYVRLLPLIKKEAGLTSLDTGEKEYSSVSGLVMQRLPDMKVESTGRSRPALLAVAAVFLLLLGAGFLFGRLRQGDTGENFVKVEFQLEAMEAKSVHLVGDFSGWDPRGLPLRGPDKEGKWTVTIKLKKQQTYTYNFLIDGEIWLPDPQAELTVDDGFGGVNSIIKL